MGVYMFQRLSRKWFVYDTCTGYSKFDGFSKRKTSAQPGPTIWDYLGVGGDSQLTIWVGKDPWTWRKLCNIQEIAQEGADGGKRVRYLAWVRKANIAIKNCFRVETPEIAPMIFWTAAIRTRNVVQPSPI